MSQSYPGLLPGPGGWDHPVEFFYESGTLLVREEYADRAFAILRATGVLPTPGAPEGAAGAYNQPEPTDHEPRKRTAGVQVMRLVVPEVRFSTIDTLRFLLHGTPLGDLTLPPDVQPLGAGAASLNHLVHITGNGGGCPAREPEPVDPGTPIVPPSTRDAMAGEGVRVVVIDTPLDETTRDSTPWLQGVEGVEEPPGTNLPPQHDRYFGHGTFIAGIVRTLAPRAEVIVRARFQRSGAALETELISALEQTLIEDNPDIISLSAGTYTFENSGLLGLNTFYESQLRHHKGVVLVAAAGNDNERAPFWPAAAPFAVSAGALNARCDGKADYSNHGGWVDVYAPGTDLINAYPTGWYDYEEPPYDRTPRREWFSGLASWSGTSFATPVVAGLIAARMSHTGENGRTAAEALIRDAQAVALPGVGAVLMAR